MRESHLKNTLVISTGVETAIASTVLIFMFYMMGTWQSLVGGGLGLITFIGGIAVSLWCFYQQRSGRFQEFMHFACFLLAMCVLGMMDPTPAFPSIPIWVKVAIMATLYGVCLTFGTMLVPDDRLDKNERAILKVIQAITAILVIGFTLYFIVHWYEHSWKALIGVCVAVLITVILTAVFIYDETGPVVVWIECLLLAGLGGLIWWAKPNLNIDPGFFALKKALLAIFVQINVSFALIFAKDLGLSGILSGNGGSGRHNNGPGRGNHASEQYDDDYDDERQYQRGGKTHGDHPTEEAHATNGGGTISADSLYTGMIINVDGRRLAIEEDPDVTENAVEVAVVDIESGEPVQLILDSDQQVMVENLEEFMEPEEED